MKAYLENVLENAKVGVFPTLEELNQYFIDLPIKSTSKCAVYSKFKGQLKRVAPPDHLFLTTMYLPKDLRDFVKKINIEAKESVKMTEISSRVVKKLFNLHKSKNIEDKLIWLLFCSGRRLEELNKLVLVKDSKNSILFSGQLKTKDAQKEYSVFLLKSFKLFEKTLMEFRESDLDFESISRRANVIIKYICEDPTIHLHDLRRLYILKLYEKGDRSETFGNFCMKHLGHSSDSTSTWYSNFRIV